MSYLFTNVACNVLTATSHLAATSGVSILQTAATRPALTVVHSGASNSVEVRTGAYHNAFVVGPPTGAGAGNVGIGTGTPLSKLHVQGTVCVSGGAVGFGTTTPAANMQLHVVGDTQLGGAVTAGETFPDGLIASFPYAGHLNDLSGCNVFGAPTVGATGATPSASSLSAAVQYNPAGRVGTSLVAVNVPGGTAVNNVSYPAATAPAASATTGARPFAPPTADLPSPTGATGFAVAAWIKPYGTASANRQFALCLEGGYGATPVTGSAVLAVGMEATTNYAVVLLQQSQGNYVTVTTATALTLNAWTHVAVVLSGGAGGAAPTPNYVVTLYINGAATGTPQSYTHSAATPAFINELTLFSGAASANAFSGELDSLSVYRRPLTAAEITALVSGPSAVAERAPAITANSLRLTGPLQFSDAATLSATTTNSSNAATTIQLTATGYDARDLSGTLAGIAANNATTGGSDALANFANGSVAPVSFGPFPATSPTEGAILLDQGANATGTGSYLTTGVSAVASNAFAFNWWQSGGFTAEAHINAKRFSATAPSPIVSHALPATATGAGIAYWSLQVAPTTNALNFAYYNGGAVAVAGTTALASNTWYHVAVSCDTTSVRLFVNGSLEATAAVSGTPQTAFATTPITVGQTLSVNSFSGYVANVRLTRGSALYTAAFTAPTTPLPVAPSGTTLLLLRAAKFSRSALQIGAQESRLVVSKISGPPPSAGYGVTTARQYPPIAATDVVTNVLPSAATYGRGYYIASASSEIAGAPVTTPAWAAFGSANSWSTLNAAGYLYNTSSPFAYVGALSTTTDVSANSYAGEWLQLQVPAAIVLTAFTLSGTSGQTTRAPASFTVLGSRNGASWVPITQHSDVAFSAGIQLFAVTTAQAYTYFRLVVTNLTGNGQTLSLNDWILYGTQEALNVTADGRLGVGVANPTAALEVAGDAVFSGSVDVGVLGDSILTTGPYVAFDGSATNRDRFVAWMQYVTSAKYRYGFTPVTLKKSVWWNASYDTGMYDTLSYGTVSGAPGGSPFWGGVLLPDGRVLFVPRDAGAIGIFNPATNTYTTTGTAGTFGYLGGVLLPDGRVLFVPNGSPVIGIFNSATNVYSTINVGTLPTNGYLGGVLLTDGRVLLTPNNSSTIGIFNPTTNAYSTIGGMPGGDAYHGGVLIPDGRVVFVPQNALNIIIFNPITNTYSTVGGMTGSSTYSGGVLLPDGRVLFVPRRATAVGIFNPTTNTYSTIASVGSGAIDKYFGGALLPDGRVVFVPFSSTTIGIFNPVTNAFSTLAGPASTAAYIGGVLIPDGRIIFIPYSITTVGILSGGSRPPPELCYHPCFNKF